MATPWFRFLAKFQQTAQLIEAGSGLQFTDNVLSIEPGGVTSAMLRNSYALSVIGRGFNSTGVPADIIAANNRTVLGRQLDQLGFFDSVAVRAVDTQMLVLGVREVTASTSYTLSDYFIGASASGGAVTLTLPTLAKGRTVVAKKLDASANAVTISGPENIDGAGSKSLAAQYDKITLIGGVSEWHVIG
jgi:hypothetical protein